MGLTTLPSTASVAEVCAIIERDGGVIVEDYLDAQQLAGINEDLRPVMASQSWGVEDEFAGKRTRRLGAVFKYTDYAADVLTQHQFMGAAKHFLERPHKVWYGDDNSAIVPSIQLGVTQVIEIHPGQGGQPLHRDDSVWLWRHPHGAASQQARVQVMVALSDFTAENGGTMVIPGSHAWPDERQPLPDEAVPTVMRAGSGLIWIGATYHAGGVNRSDAARTGLTFTLDLGYLRQEENQYLALPHEVVQKQREEVRRLIGYSPSPPFMGYVEIDGVMADPHVLFEDEMVARVAPGAL